MIAAFGNLDVSGVARRRQNARRVFRRRDSWADRRSRRPRISRENRPCAARASPSGRDVRMLKGRVLRRLSWRDSGGRQNALQFARAYDRVHFRNILANFVAIALDQAARHDQLARPAIGLVPRHFQNRVHRFLLGAIDKGAGVDHDDVGIFGAADSVPRRRAPAGPS